MMGLFNVFRKKSINGNSNGFSDLPIPREVFIEDAEPDSKNFSIQNNSPNGINRIYGFLQTDYETKGYQDALANSDDSYKKDNLILLREDLNILIQQVKTYYSDIIRELEFHIKSRERAGLVDLVEELKSRRELVIEHLSKVEAIELEAREGTGMSQRITLSYQRGFMKGLMAISKSTILNEKL